MAEDVRVIKRYSNRKLYDMRDSRYITLDKIAEFVRAGEEIRVVDNQTQEDLTAVILSQILFEQEKRKRGGFLPISTLQSILQSGEDVFSQKIARPVKSVGAEAERKVNEWVGEAERTIGRMVKKGTDLDAQATALKNALAELLQRRLDELLGTMEARFKASSETINRLTTSLTRSLTEVDALKARIEDLERTVRKLSRMGGGGKGKGKGKRSGAKGKAGAGSDATQAPGTPQDTAEADASPQD